MKLTDLWRRARESVLADDRAENSVMQTITIAVIAITSLAGLVTIPNIVYSNNVRAIQVDLKNIRTAQSWMYSDSGRYLTSADIPKLVKGQLPTTKVMPSNGVSLGIINVPVASGGGYIAVGQTKSKSALVRIKDNKVISPGFSGTYFYLDSRCDTIWKGTTTYGVAAPNQPQDPGSSTTKAGVAKCKQNPFTAGLIKTTNKPTMVRIASDQQAPDPGTKYQN